MEIFGYVVGVMKNKKHEVMLNKPAHSRAMLIGLVKRIKRHRYSLLYFYTAFLMLWFSMLLVYGVTSNIMGEFYHFIFFLRRPLVIVLNSAAFFAALIHTIIWLNLISEAISNNIHSIKLSFGFIVIICWLVTILLSVFFILAIIK